MKPKSPIPHIYLFVLLIVIGYSGLQSCRKDHLSTNPSHSISLSADSVLFDTVFTTIGSATEYFNIYNHNDVPLKISSIRLAGGTQSNFNINIDGQAAVSLTDIEIDAHDSLFVFVKVTVDPNNANTPLVISDSILIETNGNLKKVRLVAWGQDAHFIVANIYSQLLPPYRIVAGEGETVNWTNDKPYVVYGYAVVDSTGILNIGPGVNVHFYTGSGLWVYKGGSIRVNGQKDSVVTFQGSRLESYYRDVPGQWDRIWINESDRSSYFNYAIIKNGFIGIQAEIIEEAMDSNLLVINNTIIQNMNAWGLFTKSYIVGAYNSVFANCGQACVYLSAGGIYEMMHCTVGNYWRFKNRQTPAFVLTDYFENNYTGVTTTGNLHRAYIANSIIYGSNEEELLVEQKYATDFNYRFDHCLIRSKEKINISDPKHFENCQLNRTPRFEDPSVFLFNPDTLSPAINTGKDTIGNIIPTDYHQRPRNTDAGPDLGAFEY